MHSVPAGGSSSLKVMIAGGAGSGKTTFANALASPRTWRTAEGPESARVILPGALVLDLPVLPADESRRGRQDEIALGCWGAVVLTDPRSPAGCVPAVRACQRCGLGYVVALNPVEEGFRVERHHVAQLQAVARLSQGVPVVVCDARETASVIFVLMSLLSHVLHSGSRFSLPGSDTDGPDRRRDTTGAGTAGS
jgi:signal recognition particle receptor subunit beta